MVDVRCIADEFGVPIHLDGARIFNAAVALGIEACEIAVYADTVTFCLSKGLSAPVGSVITGSQEFIARARGFRRMLGGNMRQAGLLAACGIVALEQMVERLKDDHINARALADGLHRIDPGFTDPSLVETNIVMVSLPESANNCERWLVALRNHGVLAATPRPHVLRLVTNRHIDAAAISQTIAAFAAIHNEYRQTAA
jgi:threonine aldolase